MTRFILTAAVASLSLALAACGERDEANVTVNADTTAEAPAAPTTAWPSGSRIVVEEGITYRIDPGDVRVRLGPTDSRIVVEEGIRYRLDPDGTRVRIDEEGAVIVVDDVGVAVPTE